MAICEKCSYEPAEKKLIVDNKEIYLCSICFQFAPETNKMREYLQEKIDWKILESFRKYSRKTTSGMEIKARQGKIMSRAPFGYKLVNKELLVDEEKKLVVESIFQEFLNQDISLNKLAGKYSLSLNGLKKILKNFTYLGKVKFQGIVLQGRHPAIISSELFNKVQNKLEASSIS